MRLGEIEAKTLLFQWGDCPPDSHFYVVGVDDMDFFEFMSKYPDSKRAIGLNMDECCDHKGRSDFWMVYVADCFDPNIAIIRAPDLSTAEEIFVDELDWAHISEEDLNDYFDLDKDGQRLDGTESDSLHYNIGGVAYDSEQIVIREVRLARVEF